MKMLFAPLALVVMSATLAGETPELITVSAFGTAKALPTSLQVWLTLKEKGPDAAAAVQALKAIQEKISGKLAAAGIKAELTGDLPTVVDKSAQDAAMRRMRAGNGGRLKRTPKAEEKPEIELQQMVHFLVPLEAKDATAMLVEAEGLKAKINALKLVEEKPADADNSEDENNYNRYENTPAMGPMIFVYYAPLSEELRGQAVANAVKQAKDDALQAAKALGQKNVVLVSLMISTREEQEANPYQNQYDRYGRMVPSGQKVEGVMSQTPMINVISRITAGFKYQ